MIKEEVVETLIQWSLGINMMMGLFEHLLFISLTKTGIGMEKLDQLPSLRRLEMWRYLYRHMLARFATYFFLLKL